MVQILIFPAQMFPLLPHWVVVVLINLRDIQADQAAEVAGILPFRLLLVKVLRDKVILEVRVNRLSQVVVVVLVVLDNLLRLLIKQVQVVLEHRGHTMVYYMRLVEVLAEIVLVNRQLED
jgi:hypothetical protein